MQTGGTAILILVIVTLSEAKGLAWSAEILRRKQRSSE